MPIALDGSFQKFRDAAGNQGNAASKRRASKAAISLRLAMPQHGIVPDDPMKSFGKDH
jgi:hypothetical protein